MDTSDPIFPNINDTCADCSELSVSVAENPVYGPGADQTSSGSSTIRHIQNPVYYDHSDKKIDKNANSISLATKSLDDDTGPPEYTYAMVEVRISCEVIPKPEEGDTSPSFDTDIVESLYDTVDIAELNIPNRAIEPDDHTSLQVISKPEEGDTLPPFDTDMVESVYDTVDFAELNIPNRAIEPDDHTSLQVYDHLYSLSD